MAVVAVRHYSSAIAAEAVAEIVVISVFAASAVVVAAAVEYSGLVA